MRVFLIVLGFLALPAYTYAQVVFTEIRWVGSDVSSADEWFSIQNTSGTDINLSGWQVTTRKSSGDDEPMYTFGDRILAAGQSLLISNYKKDESALDREPDIVTKAVSLPNTKLLLQILDAKGKLIDQADDGVGAPLAGGKDPFASMMRVEGAEDGTVEGSWYDEGEEPKEAKEEKEIKEIEEIEEIEEDKEITGVRSETQDPQPAEPDSLRISSIIPRPESGHRSDQTITLTYTGGRAATLEGWKLDNREGGSSPVLLDGITMESSSSVSLNASWLGLSFTPEQDQVRLFDPAGNMVSMLVWSSPQTGEIIRPMKESDERMQVKVIAADASGVLDVTLIPESFTGLHPQLERYWARSSHKYLHPSLPVSLIGIDHVRNIPLDVGDNISLSIQNITWHPQPLLHAYVYNDDGELLQEKLLHDGDAIASNEPHPRRYMFLALQTAEEETVVPDCEPQKDISLRITSVYPSPEEGEEEWIEIQNTSDEDIDLCGLTIDDIVDGGSKPWTVSRSIILEPKETIRFSGDETGVRLNNTGDSVVVFSGEQVIDEFTFGAVKKGIIQESVMVSLSNHEQKMYTNKVAEQSSENLVEMLPVRYKNIVPAKVEDPRVDERLLPLVKAKKEESVISDQKPREGLPWMLLFGQSALWLVIAGRKYI